MTGFARVRKAVEQGELVLSLKSVNHRGLDLHFHMPPELDPLESGLRAVLKSGIARGHVQIRLSLTRIVAPGAAGNSAPLNRPLLEAYFRAFREAAEQHGLEGQPDLNAALRIPGMLTPGDEEDPSEAVASAVLDAAAEAVAALNAVREQEGAVTADEMRHRSWTICGLIARMDDIRVRALPTFLNRLREKLADLLRGAAVDPQRLAQEAALLADRSDIAEELIRLRTHAGQLETMLSESGEVGKRLDFLLQEMNRECNTILSKTGGLGDVGLTITELGLAAKSEIDKLREQSLNLE
jgi:uncharacterized protein (TIGR00255 family)